jgi:hypothetical protein
VAKTNTYLHAFNVGVHDKTALARVDLERMRLAAQEQTNLLCKATGPGFMRPGLEHIASTDGNAEARLKDFVFGASDAALMEFTNQSLRILVDDTAITRPTANSTVTNGDFSSSAGWTTTGVGGGVATISGGKLTLNATDIEAIAQCSRSVTTSSAGTEHALRIKVDRGPVIFRCGSSSGGDQYIAETVLRTGTHSLSFTPSGTYYVQFSSKAHVNRIVDSIQVEAAGVMELPTPWTLADLPSVRMTQSADVCFAACDGIKQRRIERRSSRSWSVVEYDVDDGPFQLNANPVVRLRPTAFNGNASLEASAPFFNQDMVGSLFKLSHSGQYIDERIAIEDAYTSSLRVSGIGDDRAFVFTLLGTWSGTVSLQRSYDDPDTGFVSVQTYIANGTVAIDDSADNAIYYYRLGFEPGDYTSGEVQIQISYQGGGGTGICRVVGYTSSTLVDIEILEPFKNSVFTRDWQMGEWSDYSGWPSAVTLSDGRLWWSGGDRIWGSVSDAFESFDEDTEGDSAPISRSIATGGVNDTKWLLSLQRLLIGTEGVVATVKSSSLDEPLTATNFGIKDSSTTGAAAIDPIKVDTRGIFVERAGTALLELIFDGQAADYMASQISKLTTDIFESGVKAIGLQRRPDTRIWLVMNDGTAACMVYEPDQEVLAFIPLETDGDFESVAVLPSLVQDRVYFSVKRTINGNTVRYIEKMAMDTEVKPSTLCKVMDAFQTGINSPASATVNVGSHLIGETVVVWADGAPVETAYGVRAEFTVNGSGNITLPSAVTNWVAGLPYKARYKSARLAYGASGTALLQKKSIDSIGLIMTDFARAGIKIGKDDPYRGLDALPRQVDGATPDAIVLSDVHDEQQFPFAGDWDTDSRAVIEVESPYTATLLSMVMSLTTNER